MLPAERRRLAALAFEARILRAGGMRATLSIYIHHAVFSMLLAVRLHFAALIIEGRRRRAGDM